MKKAINYTEDPNFKAYQIGEILEFFSRKCILKDEERYQLVTVKRRNEGIVDRGTFRGEEIKTPSQFYLKSGDFLISKRQIVHGACEIVPKQFDGAIVSNEYTIIRGKSDIITTEYFNILSKTAKMKKHYFLSSYGVDIEKMVFNVELWKKGIVYIPSIEEQKKIVNVYYKLEKKIQLQQQKVDLLKKKKKGFLQKVFPKKGEKLPEIRFKGFTGAWEQQKLWEIGKTQSGIGFPDVEQGGSEGVPFFKVSDMNIAGNEYEMITSNNYVSEEQLKRKKWRPIETVPAVIFAKVGAAIMLNRKRLVRTPFLIDNNTMAYVFDESWDTDFGKILFETVNLPKYAQVGALPSYNGSDIENIEVKVTNKDEQVKIGLFFNRLERLINLHQHKLDLLEKQKKGFMQQMFI
ncbi:restriction endonuclease subunit S [Bacillus thuringiensis]|uniref:restriction endonuclease subunit S n=1 Tax=Bacillus thuringiensis TaxID=1428 RepID=UPI00403E0A8F